MGVSGQSLPVLVQCKASHPQSVQIRELEGSLLSSAPPFWRSSSAIAFLVAEKVATKGVREALARSSMPMGFLCVEMRDADRDYEDLVGMDVREGEEKSTVTAVVKQFLWNQAAVAKCGLQHVGVGLRYPAQDVVLTWMGEPWTPPASSVSQKEQQQQQQQSHAEDGEGAKMKSKKRTTARNKTESVQKQTVPTKGTRTKKVDIEARDQLSESAVDSV